MLSVIVFAQLKTLEREVNCVVAQTTLATTQGGKVEGVVDWEKKGPSKKVWGKNTWVGLVMNGGLTWVGSQASPF